MSRFIDEPSEISQTRRLIGFGQTEEALKLLTDSISNHLRNISPPYYNSLLLSEQALLLLNEYDNDNKAKALVDQALEQLVDKDIYYIKVLIAKAEILLNTNNYASGLELANTITDLSTSLNYPEEQAIGEYLIAFGNYKKGLIHIALEFSNSAVEKLTHSENYFFYIKSLILNGSCFKDLGDLTKSLDVLKKAEDYAKGNNFNQNLLPSIFQLIGELKLNLGEYKEAERYIKNSYSLTIFSQNNRNKNIYYQTVADLADLYYLQGNIQRSITQLKTAYRDLENDQDEDLEGKLYLLNSLGKLYRRTGGLQESRIYFEEAINIIKKILYKLSFSDTHATVLINYAQTLILLKDLDEAFEAILKVKSMIAAQGGQALTPKILNTEGMYYSAIKQHELAKSIFLKSLEQAKMQNNYFDITESYLHLAEVNLEIYKEKKSNSYFFDAKDSVNKAYDLALKDRILPTITKIRILKAVMYASELNFGLALDLLSQAKIDAEEKVLTGDLENIARLTFKIHAQLPQFSMQTDVNSIISLISRFTDSSTASTLSKDSISLVTFKFTDKGPFPFFYSENLTKDEHINLQLITTIGVLLISVIGQGNAYFSGLFGPIPLKQLPDKLILCYTGMIEDENVDERLNNFNYVLLALIFPKVADDLLMYNRKSIQALFEEFILYNGQIKTWNDENLTNLHNKLTSTFDIIETKLKENQM